MKTPEQRLEEFKERLEALCKEYCIDLVIFGDDISPGNVPTIGAMAWNGGPGTWKLGDAMVLGEKISRITS